MEQTPGSDNGFSEAVEAAEPADTRADPFAASTTSGTGAPRSRRGVFLLLAGLVVAGIAAGYNWARSLPKD